MALAFLSQQTPPGVPAELENAGAGALGAARRPEAEESGLYARTGSAEWAHGRLG